MRIGRIRSDYQATVGMMQQMHGGNHDIMRGDPTKVAQAVLRIASEKDPPLRLLLGSDAVFLAGVAEASRAAEDAQWRALSMSTDFDGIPPFSETPLAQMLMTKRS
jgi:hypothetical protein